MFYYSEGIQTKTSKWMRFSLGMHGWFSIQSLVHVIHPMSWLTRESHMIITADAVKTIWQNPTPICKNCQPTRHGGQFSQVDKEHLQSPIANIILHGEKPDAFLPRSDTRRGCLLSPHLPDTQTFHLSSWLAYSFFSLYLSLSLTSNILIATVNVNGLSVSVKGQRSPE